jgi:hypothetical protein
MKNLTYISIIATLLLASCSSGTYSTSGNYDDAYYTPKSASQYAETKQDVPTNSSVRTESLNPEKVQQTTPIPQSQEPSKYDGLTDYERYALQKENQLLSDDTIYSDEGEYYYDDATDEGYYADEYYDDEDNKSVIVNNYYNYDDDYDYYYTSRLRRFHSPHHGWNYYDPFYTDLYYYNYDPFYWGVSIYSGFGYSFGYRPYYYYHPHYYNPYYGYGGYYGYDYYGYGGYPYYGSYWSGYSHGGYYGGGYYGSGYGIFHVCGTFSLAAHYSRV